MTDDNWVAQVKANVDARLTSFFTAKRDEAAGLSPQAAQLVDAVEALTMRGGKRLRPAVVVAAYRATAEPPLEPRGPDDVCAALELVQSYFLIHDDWMDGDEQRRGGPSVHAAFRQQHDPPHVGDALGVLSGDLASALAWELLLGAPWPAHRFTEGTRAFVQMHKEVLYGQQLDLTGDPDVSRMHQLKTGSYTVLGPLRLGALLADASAAQMDALVRFGEPLGEAFQLRDDLLGTFGDSKATGKPAGNDLRAGKRTSLVAEAERRLKGADRAPLDQVLGDAEASAEAVARATELLVSCGARAQVEERLESLVARARDELARGPFYDEGQAMLQDLSDRLALRDT